jgi:hypothetical protein
MKIKVLIIWFRTCKLLTLILEILAGLRRFTDQYGLSTACFCGHFHALVHHGIDH